MASEIIRISRDGLQWRDKQFVYAEQVCRGGEILDAEAAKQAVRAWIVQELKGKAREVEVEIGEELIFDKQVSEAETDKFVSEVPIEPGKIAKLVDKSPTGVRVRVINRELYEVVREELTAAKIKIKSVRPDFKFDEAAAEDKGSKQTKTKPPVLLLALLMAVLIMMAGVIWQATKKQTPPQTITTKPAVKQVKTTPEPSPTISFTMDKKTLKIQVLNGSGAVGRAAIVKNFLVSLGYSEVSTGNAAETIATTAAAVKKEKMAAWIELGADIRSKYPVASEAGELEETSPYDVEITLGKD